MNAIHCGNCKNSQRACQPRAQAWLLFLASANPKIVSHTLSGFYYICHSYPVLCWSQVQSKRFPPCFHRGKERWSGSEFYQVCFLLANLELRCRVGDTLHGSAVLQFALVKSCSGDLYVLSWMRSSPGHLWVSSQLRS